MTYSNLQAIWRLVYAKFGQHDVSPRPYDEMTTKRVPI